jgi:hypothetical protein
MMSDDYYLKFLFTDRGGAGVYGIHTPVDGPKGQFPLGQIRFKPKGTVERIEWNDSNDICKEKDDTSI